MTPLRRRRWFAAMVAFVTVLAWTLASNHCALAAEARPAHACCHDEAPAKPAAPLSTQCCEAFNVPVPEHVSAPAGHFHELRPAWLEATPSLAPCEPAGDLLIVSAQGPPGVESFAETVLNRSLLAHAPPFFVA